MDAIKRFDFEVDVSNCEKLYDYGHSTYYHRPADGQWDLGIFRGRDQHANIEQGDENSMIRVDKMDKIIKRSKFMEKDKKKDEKDDDKEPKWQDFDFMQPNQKLPNRVLPVFRPGDTVKGQLLLDISEPLEAKKVEIKLEGQAMTLVRIYHRHGYSDIKGKDIYVKEERVVWQQSEKGTDDVSDTFALLSASDSPLESKLIPAGSHKFEFEFALPSDCLGSTPNLIPSSWSDYAYVLYRLKGKIDSGKSFTKDPVTFKGLWVDQKMDIASDANDMHPFSMDENLDSGIAFWKGGRISCTAKLPRTAFIRGEEIPLTLEIENQTESEVQGVVAQVRLRGKSRTSTSKFACTHSIDLKAKKVKESGVPTGQSRVINMKLPLDFSESAIDSNLIPAGTLSDCPIIDVKYDVAIKVKRPGLHRNIEMNIPIKIGNINSSVTTGETSYGMYPKLF